jgi:RNA polymerase sigma-70 factor (ECF subfamily)
LRVVDLEGMSQKQYAAELGIDYTTAKSRVQGARKRLGREFDRCCEILRGRRGMPIDTTPRADDCC